MGRGPTLATFSDRYLILKRFMGKQVGRVSGERRVIHFSAKITEMCVESLVYYFFTNYDGISDVKK